MPGLRKKTFWGLSVEQVYRIVFVDCCVFNGSEKSFYVFSNY